MKENVKILAKRKDNKRTGFRKNINRNKNINSGKFNKVGRVRHLDISDAKNVQI